MSGIYTSAREAILSGAIQWMSDEIRVMLMSTDYVFDESHVAVDDVAEFGMGRSDPLQDKTSLDGAAGAADIAVTADAAEPLGGLVLYRSGLGDPLLVFLSSSEPKFTPQKGQIVNVEWHQGRNRIFRV